MEAFFSMAVFFCLAAIATLIYLSATIVEFYFGFKSIQSLTKTPKLDQSELPLVSIIFSALNEEKDIESAVQSLLKMDYPHFEIIAINDRSTDRTGQILQAMQAKYAQLKVINITELPQGWFGKNHALYQGAQTAHGEWLLFTDADVIMKPDTLTRAVSYAKQQQIQHLTFSELHTRNSFWLKVLLLAEYLVVSLALKPWRIRYEWSKRTLGHGAFNLVNKAAYEASGTHAAIAMQCLDDMKLGALIKERGFKQDTVDGRDFVSRQWYASLTDMIEGWKKNSFAFFSYNMMYLLGGTVFAAILFIWPLCEAIFARGTLQLLNIMIAVMWFVAAVIVCKQYRLKWYFALFYPISVLLLLYSIWVSMIATYRQNGVIWRGTFYPLAELKSKMG